MIRLILLAVLLATGCAVQLGPVGFAFGQASICRGPAESYYSTETGYLESETCRGGYVTGGAVSETMGRAIGVVGDATVRTGMALGGLPPPSHEVCHGLAGCE